MSSSRRHTTRPVVVQDHVPSAPSASFSSSSGSSSASVDACCDSPLASPQLPPSPKRVTFAPRADDRLSRPLSSTEAWSLYYFERHARHCSRCYQPGEVYRRGDRLCDMGHDLARDVACHVYHHRGDVFSTRRETHDDDDADDASAAAASRLVRVEIPHGYSQVRGLLRGMAREMRHRRRHAAASPVVSYDRSYPVRPRTSPSRQAQHVIIEPAVSSGHHSSAARRSERHTTRYPVVVPADADRGVAVQETVLPVRSRPQHTAPTTATTTATPHRGTLYQPRRKTHYRVEIRQPDDTRERERQIDPEHEHGTHRRRNKKRDSGFYL